MEELKRKIDFFPWDSQYAQILKPRPNQAVVFSLGKGIVREGGYFAESLTSGSVYQLIEGVRKEIGTIANVIDVNAEARTQEENRAKVNIKLQFQEAFREKGYLPKQE